MSSKSETQQRILDVAIDIFATKGYNGATTAEIAKEAKVAEGTVFKYYKTKKGLLREVLEYIVREVAPSILQFPGEDKLSTSSADEIIAFMKQLLTNKIGLISKRINCIKIVINEIQYHEDLKTEYIVQLVPSFIKHMEDLFSVGVKKGVFRDINPHSAVRSFVGMLAFIVLEKNVLNKELDISNELDNVFDIYLNGVKEKRGSNE